MTHVYMPPAVLDGYHCAQYNLEYLRSYHSYCQLQGIIAYPQGCVELRTGEFGPSPLTDRQTAAM